MASSIDLKKRTTSTTTMELAPDISGILKDSDLATVPDSPTDAMIAAGAAASGATAEQVRAVYRAMIEMSANDGELRLKLHTPKGTA